MELLIQLWNGVPELKSVSDTSKMFLESLVWKLKKKYLDSSVFKNASDLQVRFAILILLHFKKTVPLIRIYSPNSISFKTRIKNCGLQKFELKKKKEELQ
jgi:hypothetical protein